MADPQDQTLTPNTPTPSDNLANPQAAVDAALDTTTPASAPDSTPATVPEPSDPVVPTPPPLAPLTPAEPVAPTSTPPVTMGDDTPLAFASLPTKPSEPSTTTTTTTTTTPPDSGNSSYIPPVPGSMGTTITTPAPEQPKKKSKMGKVLLGIFAFLMLGGAVFGGYWYYVNNFGQQAEIAAISSYTKEQCNGCSKPQDGGWLRWRNGRCEVTGVCNTTKPASTNTEDPMAEVLYNTKETCNASGKGYVWCSSIDSNNKAYAFCGTAGIGCNQEAINRGYVIQIGIVKCKCTNFDDKGNCIQYNADRTDPAYTNSSQQTLSEVDAQCLAQKMGTGAFICEPGVSGACTNLNGKPYTGNLKCFCGTIQVDTGTGHTSYSSTCGCDKKTPPPSAPPSIAPSAPPSIAPTMSCTGMTRTPATGTPKIGDKLTFTCAGAVVPASAGTLSYKFRYSINSGAVTTLANKTATTAELSIAACGSYSVECQACATLNGVVTCDPTWTGASQ